VTHRTREVEDEVFKKCLLGPICFMKSGFLEITF
jgi:hypothetical protein